MEQDELLRDFIHLSYLFIYLLRVSIPPGQHHRPPARCLVSLSILQLFLKMAWTQWWMFLLSFSFFFFFFARILHSQCCFQPAFGTVTPWNADFWRTAAVWTPPPRRREKNRLVPLDAGVSVWSSTGGGVWSPECPKVGDGCSLLQGCFLFVFFLFQLSARRHSASFLYCSTVEGVFSFFVNCVCLSFSS